MKFKEWYFHIVIIAFCTSFLSSLAYADSFSIAAGYQENGNSTDSDTYAVKYIHDVSKQVDIGLLLNNSKNKTTNGIVSQYEISSKYKIPVASRTLAYSGVVLGSLQPSGTTSRNYAGIEVGVMTKPFSKVGLRLDHTVMTGINVSTMDNNFTKVWLAYDLTKSDVVALRRDFMRGDLEFDAWRLIYQHRF
jgi:hypothetical protein